MHSTGQYSIVQYSRVQCSASALQYSTGYCTVLYLIAFYHVAQLYTKALLVVLCCTSLH